MTTKPSTGFSRRPPTWILCVRFRSLEVCFTIRQTRASPTREPCIRVGARSCMAMVRYVVWANSRMARQTEFGRSGTTKDRSNLIALSRKVRRTGFTRPGSRTDKGDRKQITGTARRTDFRRIGSKTGRRNRKRTLPMTNSCLRSFGNRMAKMPVTNLKDGNGIRVDAYYEDGTEVIRSVYKNGERVNE